MQTVDEQRAWSKWKNWLNVAEEDFTQILIRRQMWIQFNEMLDQIPTDGAFAEYGHPFATWIAGMYSESQAVGIRRHLDMRSDVISLRRIISDMIDHSNIVERFSAHADKVNAASRDIDSLDAISEPIRRFVNKRVAHLDRKNPSMAATFGDLNKSIEQFGIVLRTCHLVIHDADLDIRIVDATSWTEIFSHPWLIESANQDVKKLGSRK